MKQNQIKYVQNNPELVVHAASTNFITLCTEVIDDDNAKYFTKKQIEKDDNLRLCGKCKRTLDKMDKK